MLGRILGRDPLFHEFRLLEVGVCSSKFKARWVIRALRRGLKCCDLVQELVFKFKWLLCPLKVLVSEVQLRQLFFHLLLVKDASELRSPSGLGPLLDRSRFD